MVKNRIGGKHGFEKFEEKKTKYKADAAVDVALLDIGFGMLEQQDRTQTQQDEFNKTQQNELYELKKLYNAKQKKLYIIDKSIYNQVYDIIE